MPPLPQLPSLSCVTSRKIPIPTWLSAASPRDKMKLMRIAFCYNCSPLSLNPNRSIGLPQSCCRFPPFPPRPRSTCIPLKSRISRRWRRIALSWEWRIVSSNVSRPDTEREKESKRDVLSTHTSRSETSTATMCILRIPNRRYERRGSPAQIDRAEFLQLYMTFFDSINNRHVLARLCLILWIYMDFLQKFWFMTFRNHLTMTAVLWLWTRKLFATGDIRSE